MVVLNELVELQEPTNLVTRDDSQMPVGIHLQQHHFGGVMASPNLHHQIGSLGRKVSNNGTTGRSHRLSSFRPLHGQHADLIRECIEERMTTGPTYETIDPHHLSHFGYSTDYCTVSGSGCSSGSSIARSNPGCIETILPDSRCYGTTGRAHVGRVADYQPVNNPHHNAIYCSNVKQLEKTEDFGVLSAIFTIISLISYVTDIGTDLTVCYFLYGTSDGFSLGLTFAITIIPSVTVNLISIKWLVNDNRKEKANLEAIRRPKIGPFGWIFKFLVHLLLLGPVLRYLELLWYGLESRSANKRNEKRQQRDWQINALSTLHRNNLSEGQTAQITNEPEIDYYILMVHSDRDTALLSLLKSFIQCAPQMVFQIYLLVRHSPNFNTTLEYVRMASIISSLFELSWSIASYNRALRRSTPDKRNVSRIGTVVQFLWRFCTIGSRVLAVGLFISEYSYWVCPVAIGHWGIMSIWLMHQQTRFCDAHTGEPRPCHEYLFNMIIGAIYLFCFLNVKDEPTRYKYLSYYLIVFTQNITLIVLWYAKSDPMYWYHTAALATVLGTFLIGIMFMLIYYWFLHPNGRPLWINRAARCC